METAYIVFLPSACIQYMLEIIYSEMAFKVFWESSGFEC
jgi:hypothetical protein